MQQVKCARSLSTCWPPAVQSFSSATSIMYRNNKDWDFKGNSTSLVMNPLHGKPFVQGYNQRKREYGMRTLACYSESRPYALDLLKGIINYDQNSKQTMIYDGSTKKKVNIDNLEKKNLYLFFSTLKIEDKVINSLSPVYQKLQKHKKSVIVWIPVEDKWTEDEQKTFERLRAEMPWYTIKCFPFSEDMKRKWHFKDEPIVTVVRRLGNVDPTIALPVIQEKGVEAFPNLARLS